MLEEGMLSFALLGAGWVLWLLVGLSILCIAVSIERAIYLVRDGTQSGALSSAMDAFLKNGDASALQSSLAKAGGMEARILANGLELAPHGVDAVEKAMTSTATAEKLKMERGLSILATVGSNAPFLGLFGTVLGIIQAFHDLAENTSEASEAVMAGISEALVATAVGLMVAIPAVVLYNLFSRWVKGRLGRSESLADLVLARLHG
ncbi:MAG: MotA/TolQ/ExbB proton channel family protein [Deltaproteobacteria bacterium]|nr:MAG: MotA/TolQ/ExbB proton channel family protein [Deltaproteobacteria bacterium]